MQPIPEAVAWAERADAWATRPDENDGRGQELSRWSDSAAEGRPAFPADGVGWRTETAEWRATDQSARWRQTTEWRSTTGTHGYRTTTEAWQTGAGAEGFTPPVEPPANSRQPLAISDTAYPSRPDADGTRSWQDSDGAGNTSWHRVTGTPPPEPGTEARPAWQQFTEPPSSAAPWQPSGPAAPWQASGPATPWQQSAPSWQSTDRPSATPSPSWQSLVDQPDEGRPSWNTTGPVPTINGTTVPDQAARSAPFDEGRHLVREDDRDRWRREYGADESRSGGRRRAADPGSRTGSGTGWSTRSDADNWAGHADTGSMQMFDAAALSAPSDAPSWRSPDQDWRTRPDGDQSRGSWRDDPDGARNSTSPPSWRTDPGAPRHVSAAPAWTAEPDDRPDPTGDRDSPYGAGRRGSPENGADPRGGSDYGSSARSGGAPRGGADNGSPPWSGAGSAPTAWSGAQADTPGSPTSWTRSQSGPTDPPGSPTSWNGTDGTPGSPTWNGARSGPDGTPGSPTSWNGARSGTTDSPGGPTTWNGARSGSDGGRPSWNDAQDPTDPQSGRPSWDTSPSSPDGSSTSWNGDRGATDPQSGRPGWDSSPNGARSGRPSWSDAQDGPIGSPGGPIGSPGGPGSWNGAQGGPAGSPGAPASWNATPGGPTGSPGAPASWSGAPSGSPSSWNADAARRRAADDEGPSWRRDPADSPRTNGAPGRQRDDDRLPDRPPGGGPRAIGSRPEEPPTESWRDPQRAGPTDTGSWRDPQRANPGDTGSWRDAQRANPADTGSWRDAQRATPAPTDAGPGEVPSWRDPQRGAPGDTGSWRDGQRTGPSDTGSFRDPQRGNPGDTGSFRDPRGGNPGDTGSWRDNGQRTGPSDTGSFRDPRGGNPGDTGSWRDNGQRGDPADAGAFRDPQRGNPGDTGSWRDPQRAAPAGPVPGSPASWQEPQRGEPGGRRDNGQRTSPSDTGSWRRDEPPTETWRDGQRTSPSDTGSWRRGDEPGPPQRRAIEGAPAPRSGPPTRRGDDSWRQDLVPTDPTANGASGGDPVTGGWKRDPDSGQWYRNEAVAESIMRRTSPGETGSFRDPRSGNPGETGSFRDPRSGNPGETGSFRDPRSGNPGDTGSWRDPQRGSPSDTGSWRDAQRAGPAADPDGRRDDRRRGRPGDWRDGPPSEGGRRRIEPEDWRSGEPPRAIETRAIESRAAIEARPAIEGPDAPGRAGDGRPDWRSEMRGRRDDDDVTQTWRRDDVDAPRRRGRDDDEPPGAARAIGWRGEDRDPPDDSWTPGPGDTSTRGGAGGGRTPQAVGRARPLNPNRRRMDGDGPDVTGTRMSRGDAPVGPELWGREPGGRTNGNGNWPDEPRDADWRDELRSESEAFVGDAVTEIRRVEPDWLQAEREGSGRTTAIYREGATSTDWRKELDPETGLADGESRRYNTQDFVPFKPGGAGSVSAAPVSPNVEAMPPPAQRRPAGEEWPPRRAESVPSPSTTGSYERRPVTGGLATAVRPNNLLEPDEDEIEEDTGGPLAAVGYTAVWYGVPVVLFLLYYLVVLNGDEKAHALDTLAGAAPQFGLSLVLSMGVAVGLRWASGSWKAVSVGLAAAVMGGGLATVLTSAITGNSLS